MDQITPGMTYGLAALAVAAYSIPLLLIVWLWLRTLSAGPGSPFSFSSD